MAWTPFQLTIALVMVVTGSINTLAAKWANFLYSENSIGAEVEFNHPYLQADAMFVGEFLCMFVFLASSFMSSRRNKADDYGFAQKDGVVPGSTAVENPEREESYENREETKEKIGQRNRTRSRTYSVDVVNLPELDRVLEKKPFGFKQSYLMIPASLFDMCGTSLGYVSLTLTSATMFQMLRGSVIIFTGLSSMIFLKAKLKWFQWLGMAVVFLGLSVTGLPDFIDPEATTCFLKPNESTSTPVPTISTTERAPAPEYEFDVYRLERLCPEGEERWCW